MDRKTKWRSFWLVVLIVAAVCVLIPSVVPSKDLPLWFNKVFNKKVQLGLDLQGGLHIVYSIDLDKAVEDKATEIRRDIETKFHELKLDGEVRTPLTPLGAVTVIMAKPEDKARIDAKFLADYEEIVIPRECAPEDDVSRTVCLRVSSDYADRIKESALEQAIRTVRERIDERGVAEPTVIKKNDQVIVELPGLDKEEIKRVKDLIERTAKLEFKVVVEDNQNKPGEHMELVFAQAKNDPKAKELEIGADTDHWTHRDSGRRFRDYYLTARDRNVFLPPDEAKERGCYSRDKREVGGKIECKISGRVILEEYLTGLGEANPELALDDDHQYGFELEQPPAEGGKKPDPIWRSYYLKRAVELGGTAVTSARVVFNPTTNRPEVLVNFNRWGGRRFAEMTGQMIGRKMAIILDDKIASAPVIQARIDGGASQITMGGGNSQEAQLEAQDLVNVLRTGSLPAPLREESSSEVGPLLGVDAVDKAKMSFGLGAILVVLIMVLYYRFSGLLAILALVLNLVFMMAVLSGFGATLTLPGIAALVLTIGMAVDANIIIYERIREELRSGKSVKGAVDAGFSRGVTAIIDGQLTTGVAAYVLYQYGSGPIKGFAVMLMIGIICTLFTATWVTRLFFEYYVGRGRKAAVIGI